MKRLLTLLVFALSLGAHAQGDLTALLETTGSSSNVRSHAAAQLEAFVNSMTVRGGEESYQLRKVFKGLHKSFLKKYVAYSDFDEIFSSGQYDCLTATALFSNVLDQLHYSYKIIETNYHIFLIVKTTQGVVMIETTDRIGGFITRKEAMENRIARYKENVPTIDQPSGYLYQYSFSLYQDISEQNLSGLLFFNQAVKAYNRHDWIACTSLLEKANRLYPSPRCDALGALLIQTLSVSTLEEKIKADCLARLKNFQLKKLNHFALN